MTLKVINLYGAPGVGKSTLAAGLFTMMKLRGHSVELVGEYAKDLTWSKHWQGLAHQPTVLAEQHYRLFRLEGQVEWAITDSPLPCQIAYQGDRWERAGLGDLTWQLFDEYNNFNVLLLRNKSIPYETAGRNQTEEESMKLDNVMDNLFHTASLNDAPEFSVEIENTRFAPYSIYSWLFPNGTN
jgi:hypothetical protein